MYKKTRTQLKQILRKKTKRTTKKMIKGGKLKTIIDEIIGQGTHGTIYTHKYNKGLVIKVFKNEHRGEKCIEIKENEFDIQKKIYNGVKKTDCKIIIPSVYRFILEREDCYYNMDRIFPIDGKIIIVDMYQDDIEQNFSHSKYGITQSYNKIDFTDCDIENPMELSFEIGKMFSYLHFVLQYDGYDCELIVGKTHDDEKRVFLVDFDKVSSFVFDLENDYIVYRKLDETSAKEERHIKTEKNIARLLFTAMNSMSLIPIRYDLLERFSEGYQTFLNPENEFQKRIFDLVKEIIIDYANNSQL